MKNTAYWKKDGSQGGFWSKCKDQVEAPDGRVLHKYTQPFPGERWQHVCASLMGRIESLFIDEGRYGDQLCIGLQHPQGVDVLQIPVWKGKGVMTPDAKAFIRKLPNINASEELYLSTWINTKGAYTWKDRQGKEQTSIPIHITAQQNGENVKSAFEYIEGEGYKGIPGAEVAELSSGKVFDWGLHNEKMMQIFNDYVNEHQSVIDGTRSGRGSTPAEAGKLVPAGDVEDDDDGSIPF